MAVDLKPVYRAASAAQAEVELDRFADKWGRKYPMAVQVWRGNWARIIPFFAFPAEIRKAIYTTNAIESLNYSLRKVVKNRAVFPTDEAVIKLFYLALRNAGRRWTMPIPDWRAALNQFAIHFEGRIPLPC